MQFGKLEFGPADEAAHLLAPATAAALAGAGTSEVLVAAIDPELADTQAFCDHYEIAVEAGANCVIVEAKRGERTWYAACLVLGSDKVDVNGVVRKHLGAKKASFAAMETATALTGMEYGGINPIGIPADWPVLVDEAVAAGDRLVIGSGIRGSKLLVTGAFLAALPNAEVLPIARRPERLLALRAAHERARPGAGVDPVTSDHRARHDRGVVTVGGLHQPLAAGRQVVAHLGQVQPQPFEVDDVQIRLLAGRDDARGPRGRTYSPSRSSSSHDELERQPPARPVAYPMREHEARHAGVRRRRAMRTAVGAADDGQRMRAASRAMASRLCSA